MRCHKCTYENAAGSRFCTVCGVRLELACGTCGRACSAQSRFCGWCGAPRTEGLRLTEPDGERKQATVLFADVVGSTELIAGLDAEAARDRLEPLVKAMAHAVRRFDGTVLRTLGDGLKAAFGVPHAQEGHALLACQAALAMQDAVAALPGTATIRIGLHSGEVVAGTLDTGSAIEHEAQGMTVHLASRIEQSADPGSICISGECRALIGAYCDIEMVGERTLKGISAPVEIYRLIGLKPAVNSEHFRGSGLMRLRGRAAELAILQRAVLDPARHDADVIGIAAPAGVGKSRLCFEFAEWCRGRHVEVLEARAHVFGQATPLLPVLEVLRAFFRISPTLDPAAARQKISERLLALDPSLADALAVLAHFLNVADPEQASQSLDPMARHARLRDIVSAMVRAAGRRTAVLIVEDLHWLDEASHDFVETMAQAVAGTNIVMVVTFRPPWSARWTIPQTSHGSESIRYRELRLAELDQRDMRSLVRDLAGDAPALEGVVEHVAERSGGNPFFAEELMLSLAQSGVLRGGRGDYRLASSGWHEPALPTTVEAVIGARIDRLTERQKAVLQIGAVMGKEFPRAVVQEVAGIAEAACQPLFDYLCVLEMIQPCTTDVGAGFAFRHPLIQEVAYRMQLRTRRTRIHEAVADAIKRFDWGLRDESAGLLAHHYEAAGQDLEAATHLQRAARWIGRTNSARALADWKKLRRMMQGQPDSKMRDQFRALAGGQLLNLGWRQGMAAEEAQVYAEEALHHARSAGDRKHEVLLLGGYGRLMAATGAADDYVRLVREALALTDPETNPEGTLLLNGLLSQACRLAGFFTEALGANDAALAALDAENSANDGDVLVQNVDKWVGYDVGHWIRCLRIRPLVFLGRFDEAESWLARTLQLDPGKIEPMHQWIPHVAAVEMAWHRGNAVSGRWHARAAASFADRSGMPYVFVAALGSQGLSASIEGDFEAAKQYLLKALETARQGRAGLEFEAKLLVFLAENHDRAGDPKQAAEVARESMTVARRRTDRLSECHASIVAARALLSGNRLEYRHEAESLLDNAESLLDITHARILLPMLQRAKAELT